MAAKVRIMKLLQEIRGLAEITNRRPQPRQPGLFLIQLRSHVTHTTGARRRQTIAIEMLERPDIPHPVKITHLRPAPVPPVSPTTATATATVAAS
jgi:hypothetical protein